MGCNAVEIQLQNALIAPPGVSQSNKGASLLCLIYCINCFIAI
jgi:hypothetical protein